MWGTSPPGKTPVWNMFLNSKNIQIILLICMCFVIFEPRFSGILNIFKKSPSMKKLNQKRKVEFLKIVEMVSLAKEIWRKNTECLRECFKNEKSFGTKTINIFSKII